MSEDFSLPVGSIGKIVILSDTNVCYGYNEDSEVVGKASKGDECYVYKIIDNHYLIDNHQWIVDGEHLVFKDVRMVDEPVSENKEVEEIVEEVQEVIETSEQIAIQYAVKDETQDIPTYEDDEAKKPTDNLFKRIGKIFSKRT